MKEFRDQFAVPPGGWWYEHPETKHVIRSTNQQKLVLDIRDYCAANNLPIPARLAQLVVEQICERIPAFCYDTEPPGPLDRLRTFATAMAQWVRDGFAVVPNQELERRRDVCETCQFWAGESSFGYGRCAKCGCTGLKLFMPQQECPIGKWTAYKRHDLHA